MSSPIPTEQLKTIIIGAGLVKPEVLDNLIAESKKSNISFEQLLIDKSLISDENLGRITADALAVPFISLSKISIDQSVLNILPEIVARKQKMIVFARDQNGLKVATLDPKNNELTEMLSKKTGENINVYFATNNDLEDGFSLYQKGLQKTFDELLTKQIENAAMGLEKDTSVSKIVDLLINYAFHNKASDIHIEPLDDISLVRFRIDGVLHDVLNFKKDLHEQVITKIKVLSKLRTDEHLSAQDGKLQVRLDNEDLDIRVSIVPITNGEKAVLRLLSSRARQFSLSDLGMSPKDLEKLQNGFNKPFGMVLSTGPTGCGKTTTIYSVLKIINVRERNIDTIEDPVEYDIPGINQIQVNPKTNLTFADGLRVILRQDPDIIFVGEIRDKETAGIAINSAMTGHLVLSTLHTNDAATTLPRLIDMDVEPFLVASTVNTIIAQRLVRKICERCRFSMDIDSNKFEKSIPRLLINKIFGGREQVRIYQGKGCPVCHNSGYVGRIGVFEILEVTDSIRELITSKANAEEIARQAIKEGMTTMLEDGLYKVSRGITTIEEILKATKA